MLPGIGLARSAVLAGVVANLVVGVAALVLYPAVLGAERTPFVLADMVLLVAYGAWVVVGPAPAWRCLALGCLAGLIQVGDIAREYFTGWSPLLLPLALLASLLCFGAAGGGWRGGVWAALTAMLLIWLLAWWINFAYIDRLASVLVLDPDFASGSLKEPRAYAVWNTFSAALSHAVLLPLMGAAAGGLGSLVTRRVPNRSGFW